MSKWHEQPLMAFDTETSGTSPHDDRIVTAAVVFLEPGQRPRDIRWVIDPGVEIPAEAAAVHGWTNERLAALIGRPDYAMRSINGADWSPIPRDVAVFEITGQLAATIAREQALVVHNAAYDLTLLEAEARRHDVAPLSTRPLGVTGVVDPMVVEKQFDPYRKTCYKAAGCNPGEKVHECGGCRGGKYVCRGCGATDKTLTSLCAHYGVVHSGAHEASADALAAARLLYRLLGAWPQLGTWKLSTLHGYQVGWRKEQCDSLRAYFDKVGSPHDGIPSEWPIVPTPVAVAS